MFELLWKYILGPIIADSRGVKTLTWNGAQATTGYNPVNTVFYVILASATIYLIYYLFEKKEIEITSQTAIYSLPFVLLGGTLRFLDDAQLVPYPFSILLITPIIYFLIAAIFVPAVYKLQDRELSNFGIALLLPTLLYSIMSFESINYLYIVGVLVLTGISTALYYFLLKDEYTLTSLVLLAFTQFFEGSASMLGGFYGYNAKQLLAQIFNSILGFPGVFIMKIGVLAVALNIIMDIENELMKSLVLIALYSIGLGTGFRVFLRVTAGV